MSEVNPKKGHPDEPPSVHPLISFNYLPRCLGYLLFGLIFLSLFYNNTNPFIWTAIIFQTLTWPHIAYLIGKKSSDPRKAEYRNMYFESFLGGVWIVILSFRLWPCTAFFIGFCINFIATGGLRFFFKGVFAFFCGIAAASLFIGVSFSPETGTITALASILAIITYSGIVAWMSFIFSKQLSRNRKNLKKAHKEVKEQLSLAQHEVSKRKQIETELKKTLEIAEAASKEKSRFLASMSHEIRTPMNAILGMTDLALQTDSPEERLDYLATVKESATHLLTIINDILDFSKTESGKLTLEFTDFDLFQLLEGVVKTFRFESEKKGLTLKLDIDVGVTRYIKGDPARLKQVLINITGNAFKFTHEGGVTIRVETTGDPETLTFTITDTGIGIHKEQTETIFESFSQAEKETTRLYGGTGLGLAISKRLVELMEGDIRVESQVGRGSTFRFSLPLYPGEQPLPDQEATTTEAPEKRREQIRILLAEDNPVNIRIATIFLNKLGHSATIATNGNEALEKLKQGQFDLVLMDIEMPEMNGLEATSLIRKGKAGKENAAIPIIAMTAHVLEDMVQECKNAGMDHVISKPIDINTIEKTMLQVLIGKNEYPISNTE